MAFRKRNVILNTASPASRPSAGQDEQEALRPAEPGTRPSPLDGRPILSTGSPSLDQLVAGAHAGLPLGTALLIEESGTTDFGGVLLRYYAAEGLVQGHRLHVIGHGHGWTADLPGLTRGRAGAAQAKIAPAAPAQEAMRIAWRYQALGNQQVPSRDVHPPSSAGAANIFCHQFDLSRRLEHPIGRDQLHTYLFPSLVDGLSTAATTAVRPSPLYGVVDKLSALLQSTPASSIHRVVVPGLLNPQLYHPDDCHPSRVLWFLHAVRSLLRQHCTRLSVCITLSADLFPRSTGLTRWMEILADGVLELNALPRASDSAQDERAAGPAQGLARFLRLPVYSESGAASSDSKASFDQFVFHLSSSGGLILAPFALPPVGDGKPAVTEPTAVSTERLEF